MYSLEVVNYVSDAHHFQCLVQLNFVTYFSPWNNQNIVGWGCGEGGGVVSDKTLKRKPKWKISQMLLKVNSSKHKMAKVQLKK